MAFAASMLRSEMRRHLLMNFSLVTACVVGGTVVTNERGLFVPIEFRMSDTARAFSAMFTQSHLLPEQSTLSDVRMVSPLDAFEVTADSRDLRRRLMENFQNFGGGDNNFGNDNQSNDPTNQLQQSFSRVENQALQVAEGGTGSTIASNANTSGTAGGGGGGGGNSGGSSSSGGGNTVTTNSVTPTSGTTGTNQTSQTSTTSVPTTTTTATSTPTTTAPINPSSPIITTNPTTGVDTVGAVPEPSTWAMLIAGFGFVGYFLRTARRRKLALEADVEA